MKLNTRQWALYNFIKEYSEQGEFKHRSDIQKALEEHYPSDTKDKNNSSSIRKLNADIQAINECPTIQKIIISSSYRGIKVANEEEARNFLKRKEIELKSRMKRLFNEKRKISLNEQGRLKFDEYQREFVESFIQEGANNE